MAQWQGREPDPDADSLPGLLEAGARGDERAWKEIIERYGRRVFALAKSRCRNVDVAEDITQSVFVTVAGKLRQGLYTEKGRFESWLFRVTMNRVRDEVRRAKRRPISGDSGESLEREPDRRTAAGTADDGGEGALNLAALRGAIEELGEADREVVELRHHAGLSFKQMSELLDEPVGTLLARHHRALRKLREIIERQQGERGSTAERQQKTPVPGGD